MNWNVFDTNKANFKVNHSYRYGSVTLATLTDSKQEHLKITVFKDCKLVGKKEVLFDDEGARKDAIDFIFMLKDFDWFREDITATPLR